MASCGAGPQQTDQLRRYARQLVLPQWGQEGQAKLAAASVLVVGAGGLGSPLIAYLAASGIGRIGIIDHDRVELSNLQRQILFETADIGRKKAQAAADRAQEMNPTVALEVHSEKLTQDNASALIANYDIVADGCDDFATRFIVHQACFEQKRTLVSAAVIGFSGQLSVFKAYLGDPHPCYRCWVAQLPPASRDCAREGIAGPVAGLLGSWQALEVIKEILGQPDSLSGRLMRFDGLKGQWKESRILRDAECMVCAEKHGHGLATSAPAY